MIPKPVIEIRRTICKSAKCNMQLQLNFADPCAICPNGHWGIYTSIGCPEAHNVLTIESQAKQLKYLNHNEFKNKPGDLLSKIIFKITGQITGPNCSCNTRKRKMNEWGWWGCWKNRKIITDWVIEEARKRGHNVEGNQSLALLKAAFREINKS